MQTHLHKLIKKKKNTKKIFKFLKIKKRKKKCIGYENI